MKNTEKIENFNNLQKRRTGISRLWNASKYSWSGIKDAWGEPAFRLETKLFILSLPLSQAIGENLMEKLLLISSIWLLLVVEVINSAIESAIDRIGLQYHDLSRKAKDLGSASVLMTIIFCLVVWSSIAIKNYV